MRKSGVFFLIGVLVPVLWGSSLHADESVTESGLAYRRATLETLVAESQREKKYPRRHFPHELPYFQNPDSSNSLELEPAGRSAGAIVGA